MTVEHRSSFQEQSVFLVSFSVLCFLDDCLKNIVSSVSKRQRLLYCVTHLAFILNVAGVKSLFFCWLKDQSLAVITDCYRVHKKPGTCPFSYLHVKLYSKLHHELPLFWHQTLGFCDIAYTRELGNV